MSEATDPLRDPSLLEELAALEHDRWSHWQRYLHSKCQPGADGTLTIPADLVAHWAAQMTTEYSALTEEEKESDREQVRRYLPVIATTLDPRKDES
jgi:hypothetical protein